MAKPSRYLSPLRYPGGKARMAPALAEIAALQWTGMPVEVFMEPFAGGAGAGLGMLERDAIEEVWLVEKHPALAAFWQTVVSEGDQFADEVERTEPSMARWEAARCTVAAALAGETIDPFLLAVAAFIINRCSRSGIVTPNVGPIGGKQQTGKYRVGDRWNGPELADRIRAVARHGASGRLKIIEGDAIESIAALPGSGIELEVFLFVDPPYIREGNRLYAQGMDEAAHQALAAALTACPSPWLLTYDDEPTVVEDLYPQNRALAYRISNTANQQRRAWEYAVLGDTLAIGSDSPPGMLPDDDARWVTAPLSLFEAV